MTRKSQKTDIPGLCGELVSESESESNKSEQNRPRNITRRASKLIDGTTGGVPSAPTLRRHPRPTAPVAISSSVESSFRGPGISPAGNLPNSIIME
jgi:hypothetical protein